MDLQDTFISNLKSIRKMKHITQERLAELCNTDTAYIGQIETKKRFPSITFIEKIADALEIEAFLLFQNPDSSYITIKKIETLKSEFLSFIEHNINDFLKTQII